MPTLSKLLTRKSVCAGSTDVPVVATKVPPMRAPSMPVGLVNIAETKPPGSFRFSVASVPEGVKVALITVNGPKSDQLRVVHVAVDDERLSHCKSF